MLAYIMLMIALIPSLVCTDFGEGFRAYKRGDYTTAFREFRKGAGYGARNNESEGSDLAGEQYFLGLMYEKGQGVPQDFWKAATWYRRAALQNHAYAQLRLGNIYSGISKPDDNLPHSSPDYEVAEAPEWYRKAANQGLADAQFYLGRMYEQGKGVAQDGVEAVRWYRKAAHQKLAVAQFRLGFIHEQGRSVPKDYVLAQMWFNLVAASGDKSAVEYRDALAKQMTPWKVAEAQKLARIWKPNTSGIEKPADPLTGNILHALNDRYHFCRINIF